MTGEPHERARNLLRASTVEGISVAEQTWLDAHLEECSKCSAYASGVERTVASLRSISVPLDPSLVAATRRRVQVRAHELREQEARLRALWVSCTLSWLLGVVSAPLLWWGLKWIGQQIAVPQPVWVTAFLLSWIAPAAVVAAALTWRRSRIAGQAESAPFDTQQ